VTDAALTVRLRPDTRFVADAVTPGGSGTDDPPRAGRLRATFRSL